MSKSVLRIGCAILAFVIIAGVVGVLFSKDTFAQATYPTYPSKSKGQYSTALGTSSVTFTADTGYQFCHITIINDDSANNLYWKIGSTITVATTEFFLKPGETYTFDCACTSLALAGSSTNTDYRIVGLEVSK